MGINNVERWVNKKLDEGVDKEILREVLKSKGYKDIDLDNFDSPDTSDSEADIDNIGDFKDLENNFETSKSFFERLKPFQQRDTANLIIFASAILLIGVSGSYLTSIENDGECAMNFDVEKVDLDNNTEFVIEPSFNSREIVNTEIQFMRFYGDNNDALEIYEHQNPVELVNDASYVFEDNHHGQLEQYEYLRLLDSSGDCSYEPEHHRFDLETL